MKIAFVFVGAATLEHLQSTRSLTKYILFAVGCIGLLFLMKDFGTALIPVHTFSGWANVIALALLPTVVSLICTTVAIHNIGSTPTAILGALEPVTALFFGVMLFNEQLTPRILLGIVLVLTAVTLIVIEKPVTDRLRHILKHS